MELKRVEFIEVELLEDEYRFLDELEDKLQFGEGLLNTSFSYQELIDALTSKEAEELLKEYSRETLKELQKLLSHCVESKAKKSIDDYVFTLK